MIRKLRNIILVLLAALTLLLGTAVTLVYYYRSDLVRVFIEKINRQIDTPVDVAVIDLNMWDQFPAVTFELQEVKIHESMPLANDYLCEARKIRFSFDVFQLIFGQYVLKSLIIDEARINLVTAEEGQRNHDILRQKPDSAARSGGLDFAIQEVILNDVHFTFRDLGSGVSIKAYTGKLNTHVRKKDQILACRATGLILNHDLEIENTSYLREQELMLATRFMWDLEKKTLEFDKGAVKINGHDYLLTGKIQAGEEKQLDLQLVSEKNSVQTLIALLPVKLRNELKAYRSEGSIGFSAELNGPYAGGQRPAIAADFHCEDVTFYYPGYEKAFRDLNFQGRFSNGPGRNLQSSLLEIRDFSGRIDEHLIQGRLVLNDLKNLNADMELSGTIDLDAFLKTFPVKDIRKGTGRIDFGVRFEGKIRELRETRTGSIRTSGEINLKEVDLLTRISELSFSGINGDFFFNNMDLGIQDFRGAIGNSDFHITGLFRNIIPFFFYKDRPLNIEADLRSRYLDLNELFTLNFSGRDDLDSRERKYHLGISPKLNLDFNCDIRQADLRRFHGERIRGTLAIHDQIAVVEDVSMNTMGGRLLLSGSIMARDPVDRDFLVDGILENIYIDSVFYVFENFNQRFLMDENLKGQIDASVNCFFRMDDNLHFNSGSLDTYVEARIKQGQLLQFEPIQSLGKYLKNEDLTHVRFSDLQNNIRIRDRTVFIPEMEIISSEYEIRVSGTHTFDQQIDYHFRIPLDQFRGNDPDERFGRIEDSEKGPPNLFLSMKGTAMDYKVSYDTRAVADKIRDDLKEEGNEIRDLFRKKPASTGAKPELEEDEFFEFGEDQ